MSYSKSITMSINLWREVRYTDDGCRVFQCLMCYKQWEARTDPGYITYDTGVYVPYFVYCPCCATKWDGKKTSDVGGHDNESGLGQRRWKIKRAIETYYWDNGYPEDNPKKVWAIEGALYNKNGKLRFKLTSTYYSMNYSAIDIYNKLYETRKRDNEDNEDNYGDYSLFRAQCVDYIGQYYIK